MKRIFMCDWFFIGKCIGHYVLDFVLVNVLDSRFWIGSLAAFAIFSLSAHFISFPIFFEKTLEMKGAKMNREWIGMNEKWIRLE